MGSRKEEERNEKIIRGLMKLPPNRRCINCNSLGPQYVCTNFWTFVCMTCSGIHREFTHRVKSVSMAKFTSQEVEALQNGGNQRARDLYLRDWDFQRQRLPDSSNVDKIREFIRNVYVNRRYSGSKSSDKPPRDMQSLRIHDDETRRASSYHSYSQSPPYDYQYEDRRYGKQAAALTRKPGSDKGHYEGRMSSLIYSPGRFSDHAYSDRDIRFSSPSYQRSRPGSSEDLWSQARNTHLETNAKKDADGICHPHLTTSLGSTDSNLSSFGSQSSGGLVYSFSEPVQGAGSHQDKVSAIPRSAGPARSVCLDFSNESGPFSSSASSVDLFQLPASSQAQSVDLFQSSVLSSVPPLNGNQPSQTSQPSPVDFFVHTSQLQSAAILDEKSSELSVPKNEGWATFDLPPCMSSTAHAENPSGIPSTNEPLQAGFDPFLTLNPSIQWPSFETSNVDGSSVISNTWHDNVCIGEEQASVTATNSQPWNAFEDSGTHIPVDTHNQGLELHNLPSNDDEYFGFKASEGFNRGGMQGVAPVGGFDDYNIPSPAIGGLPYPPSVLPLMGETQSNAVKQKSTNPFDLPFDSDIEHSNMFFDMSSLQAALPDTQLPSTFPDGIAEPWLPQNSVPPYMSAAGQGGLAYMAAQPPSPKLPNVHPQGPVASLGGNPFA